MQTLNPQPTGNHTATSPFLLVDQVSKVYPTPQGDYSVLKDINLQVQEGEFITVIGHSGCGKSTLLNIIAGFTTATTGEVRLPTGKVTRPGPDRMVVFQNYALLPWKTALENVRLAVKSVLGHKSKAEQTAIAKHYLSLVGLEEAFHKKPGQLSGGMKQRVAIARALAICPQVLILDEPFGALDPMTREELQDELLNIWNQNKVTVLMITHDIDEALYLSDRIVMMTNGPAATIGEILDVPFARPRSRQQIIESPKFYELRNHAMDFLYARCAHAE